MFEIIYENNNVYIKNIKTFNLAQTLDCGQAFRWRETEDGIWQGVAFGRLLKLEKTADGTVILYNTAKEDFENLWLGYFDLERDYDEIISKISTNSVLKTAAEYGYGIRVLNQEPWETLCSFIISQNNNIARIKSIIERLCENFGEDKGGYFAFPTAETVAALTPDDLAVLRAGFRAKYILDAASKVSSGEIDLSLLSSLPTDDARKELMKIKGVGPKVADCALLFSHRHTSAFPRDVWINRAMDKLFGGNLPKEAEEFAGIVQQYIFYYARQTKLSID